MVDNYIEETVKIVGNGTNGRISSDYFGWSVSVYGDTAIVGAELQDYDDAGANYVNRGGAAYIFTRNGTAWAQQAKIVGTGTNGRIDYDYFGWSVSVYSDTAIVGASGQSFDASGSTEITLAGAAYIFTRDGTTWAQQQKIVGTGTNGRIAEDYFGNSVSVYSDTAIVGAYSCIIYRKSYF